MVCFEKVLNDGVVKHSAEKHLYWSLYSTKLQAQTCDIFIKRLGTGVFLVFKNTYLYFCIASAKRCLIWNEAMNKYIHMMTFIGKHRWWRPFIVQLRAWGLTVLLKRGSITDTFLWKLWSFREYHYYTTLLGNCLRYSTTIWADHLLFHQYINVVTTSCLRFPEKAIRERSTYFLRKNLE